MKEWLGDWLREVIMIVLLASFIDLLLPGRNMQRYVKVVLSLFILLTILSPVVSLFHLQFDWEDAKARLNSNSATELASLSQIREEGQEWRQRRNEQATELAEEELAKSIKLRVQQELDIPVLTVAVELAGEAGHEVYVDSVLVQWDGNRNRQTPVSEDGVTPVSPVAAVEDISIRWGGEGKESRETGESRLTPEPREKPEKPSTEVGPVVRFIADEWGIPEERITIADGR